MNSSNLVTTIESFMKSNNYFPSLCELSKLTGISPFDIEKFVKKYPEIFTITYEKRYILTRHGANLTTTLSNYLNEKLYSEIGLDTSFEVTISIETIRTFIIQHNEWLSPTITENIEDILSKWIDNMDETYEPIVKVLKKIDSSLTIRKFDNSPLFECISNKSQNEKVSPLFLLGHLDKEDIMNIFEKLNFKILNRKIYYTECNEKYLNALHSVKNMNLRKISQYCLSNVKPDEVKNGIVAYSNNLMKDDRILFAFSVLIKAC